MDKKQAGFTLVEIIIVMAIASLLLIIVLIGQRHLQDQARFDGAIDQIVQDVSYARNYATSNINESGDGNDTSSIFAGVALEFDNAHLPAHSLGEIEPLYSAPLSNGDVDMANLTSCPPSQKAGPNCKCPPAQHPDDSGECLENFLGTPPDLKVNNGAHATVYFINTKDGLRVCTDLSAVPAWISISAACAAPVATPLDIDFKDSKGFTATIEINGQSGLARRLHD